MGLWNGNLRNKLGDVVIDSVLLLAIFLSYLPQIVRIIRFGSIKGISVWFLTFGALYTNIQLAYTLLLCARAWPSDGPAEPVLVLIGDHSLQGIAAIGAVLGLVQVALQWVCTITIILLFTMSTLKPGIAMSVFTHALLFLLPAVILALPTPSPRNWDNEIFTGFTLIFNIWFALLFNFLQFIAQNRERSRQNGDPCALSMFGLGVQAVTLTLVAMRWFLRLGNPNSSEAPMSVSDWYVWGFIPINYIIQAIGCLVLLVLYVKPTQFSAPAPIKIGQPGPGSDERARLLV